MTRLDEEAHILLDLIDAEFRSDQMSVQCFDLRIVERVRKCVEEHTNHRMTPTQLRQTYKGRS